ncbi:unnamed protein product [Tilletia controversa]|uniref:Cellulase n=3 Tax=Tilletia TaxID=13289 RepID=A0A8X7SYT5_9BASI|nr:hypothetical protein CF336_g2805 [Tilletia laevis]KAE8202840.1 hypothetical protein CF328_g1993 [Tilletia controversa]KAE8262624.1 hypothetical protein A4X03_0g2310 [Tilletia caries]KAE8207880.1 hypothetical protein CF335_g831 [Tilletia laevis]KAE8251798.1 hypothetical protein A4X06_0g2532 [Tilletia controversa]
MRCSTAFFALCSVAVTLAAPSAHTDSSLQARAPWADTIWITSADDFCMIMPKSKMTIGDSEFEGGTRSYCTKPADSAQGHIPAGLWKSKYVSKKRGKSGGRQVQITGCINPSASSRLIPSDGGGQYDSNGGDGGKGNPRGSVCLGYNSYVELVEPDVGRACIRCCENPSDCPLSRDTSGCPSVIPGRYDGCN